MRLVKGSHIVVPRAYDGEHAYVLQSADRRIVFAIPYAEDFTLIGTTDVDFVGDPAAATISADEIDYLCRIVSTYLSRAVTPGSVVWSFAGVRALVDDPALPASRVSRDYSLELAPGSDAPLLSILGGKLTTYRKLAEQAVDILLPRLERCAAAWTAATPLPGAEDPDVSIPAWLPADVGARYSAAYGGRAAILLRGCAEIADLGIAFGAGLYAAEVRYLMQHEWAHTADDVLWRRTKLGLRFSREERRTLTDWMAGESPSSRTPA
jgi:glycerol-3-phosphate dehydrogenase